MVEVLRRNLEAKTQQTVHVDRMQSQLPVDEFDNITPIKARIDSNRPSGRVKVASAKVAPAADSFTLLKDFCSMNRTV